MPFFARKVPPGVRLIVRLPWSRARVEQDLNDEWRFHLEARAADLRALGMSEADAIAEAQRQFGDLAALRHDFVRAQERRVRRRRVIEWARDLWQDIRYTVRGFIREPLFFAFAVLTLALGIGANAAMFGIVDKLLFRGPAHVLQPARVARLYWTIRQPAGELQTSAAFDKRVYVNLLAESRGFSGIAMSTVASSTTLLGSGPNARLVSSAAATANFMSVLGAQPVLGRFFTRDEQESDVAPAIAVIGYGLWQNDFGGDRRILGRTVTISLRPFTIVGVAPEGFTGAELDRVDIWFPLAVKTEADARHWGPGYSAGPTIVGRLRPGLSLADASRDATAAYRRTYDGRERNYAEATITAAPLHFGVDGTESTEANIARWLIGVAAVVLLIACANIVNLLLARAVRRRREIAVRVALGADRVRLLQLLLASSLLLSATGAAAGLLVAVLSGNLVRRVLLPNVDWTSGPVDSRVLAFSLVVAMVTGVSIGILPAARAGRTDVTTALKTGAREGGTGRSLTRTVLMATQAALAMVLLIGAGLFVRSLEHVRHVDIGLDADRVLVVRPRWPVMPPQMSQDERTREQQRRENFARAALERLTTSPVVEHAAAAVGMPFLNTYSVTLSLPGRDSLPRLTGGFGDPDVSAVSPDYFATIGTRLVRGRVLSPLDGPGSEPVAVVSETMARVLWPNVNPVGQYMLVGGGPATRTRVVGVVRDVRRSAIKEDPIMHYYVPLGQLAMLTNPDLIVRPRGDGVAVIPAVRAMVRQIDPTISFVTATTIQDRIQPQLRSWRIGAMMFSLFAVMALVVAAIGTFSIVAYLVEQRRHEVGVRIALGARPAHIVRLMLRGPVVTTALGAAVGAAFALLAGRFVEPLLFETNARDPVVIGAVGGVLIVASLFASMIPALRARSIDPIRCLREE